MFHGFNWGCCLDHFMSLHRGDENPLVNERIKDSIKKEKEQAALIDKLFKERKRFKKEELERRKKQNEQGTRNRKSRNRKD